MKILYITTFLHYGSGRAILELAKEAIKRGHSCHIAATESFEEFSSDPILIHEANKHGITVSLHEDLYTRQADPDQLTALFKQNQFDLIHSHAQVPGMMAAKHSKAPQISSVHAWSPTKPDWMKKQDVTFLNSLFCVHAVSNDVSNFLIKEGVKDRKIHMIYNGLDLTRLDSIEPLRKEALFRIGTVANLTERKGINYLIEAVSLLPKDIEVIIAGTGSEILHLKKLASPFRSIKFIGHEPNPYPLMKSFDLFVLPSLSEGLPMSLVESAYMEVPILTTDVQGNREIAIPTNSLLVPPANSKALADAIKLFLQSPGKTASGKEWVKKHFSAQICFDQMFTLYDILSNS